MSDEIKRILTNCHNCGVEIRAIVPIKVKYDVYWCDKIKCKLILTKKHNLNWRMYIVPNKWDEAKKLIEEMDSEEFK